MSINKDIQTPLNLQPELNILRFNDVVCLH